MKKVLAIFALAVSLLLTSGMASATSFGANWDVSNSVGSIETSVDQGQETYTHTQNWGGQQGISTSSEGYLSGTLGNNQNNPRDTVVTSVTQTGSGFIRDVSDYNYNSGEIGSRHGFLAEANDIEVQDILRGNDYNGRTSDWWDSGIYHYKEEDNAFLHSQGFEAIDARGFSTGFQGEETISGGTATTDLENSFSDTSDFDAYSRTWEGNFNNGATDIHSWNDAVGIDSGKRGFSSEVDAYQSGKLGDFNSDWSAN